MVEKFTYGNFHIHYSYELDTGHCTAKVLYREKYFLSTAFFCTSNEQVKKEICKRIDAGFLCDGKVMHCKLMWSCGIYESRSLDLNTGKVSPIVMKIV